MKSFLYVIPFIKTFSGKGLFEKRFSIEEPGQAALAFCVLVIAILQLSLEFL